MPKWLYGDIAMYDTYAYWTSTPGEHEGSAISVNYEGYCELFGVDNSFAIRPVITLSKSSLN